jgi:hypothetical protein
MISTVPLWIATQALRAWLWSLDVFNPWPEVAKIA